MATGIALVISALALVTAIWANITSRDAATAAEKSAIAAEESNEIAREARAQALEISDVEWKIEESGSEILIRNVGQSTAFAVAALVRIEGVRVDVDGGDIPSDHVLRLDARESIQAKAAGNARAHTRNQSFGGYRAPTRIRVAARMAWQSGSGVPHVRVLDPVILRTEP